MLIIRVFKHIGIRCFYGFIMVVVDCDTRFIRMVGSTFAIVLIAFKMGPWGPTRYGRHSACRGANGPIQQSRYKIGRADIPYMSKPPCSTFFKSARNIAYEQVIAQTFP